MTATVWPKLRILVILTLTIFYCLFLLWDPTEVPNAISSFQSPDVKNVSLAGFTPTAWVSMLVMILLISWVAYGISASIWQEIPGSVAGKMIASFVLGYVMIQPVLRAVTWLVPPGKIYHFTLLGLLTYLFFDWRGKAVALRNFKQGITIQLGPIAVGTALFIFCLVVQVYFNHFSWVGHGPQQYSFLIPKIRAAGTAFPIFSQHYDELLFAYFLSDPFNLTFNAILPMWLTLAAVKTSSLFLIYYICRHLSLGARDALALTSFLGFASFSLNPTRYFFLFDSINPLAMTVHSGRVLGIPVTLLIVSWFLRKIDRRPYANRLPWIFWALLGAGITASSISNWLVLALVFIMLWIFANTEEQRPLSRTNVVTLFMMSFGGVFLTYSLVHPTQNLGHPGWPLSLAVLALLIYCALSIRDSHLTANFARFKSGLASREMLIFLVSSIVAVIIGGNIFADNSLTRHFVEARNQLFSTSTLTLQPSLFDVSEKFPVEIFRDFRELNEHNAYSRSGLHFLSYFGLVYLFSGAALFTTVGKNQNAGSIALQRTLLFTLLFCSTFFLYIDFFNGLRPWVKTRFLEIPVYLVLFCSVVLMLQVHRKRWLSWGFTGLAFISVLLPSILTHRWQQWKLNSLFLFNELFK